MIATITLTKKAAGVELSGQKAKIVALISRGATEYATLKSRCRQAMSIKNLRRQLRALRAARLISVTKQ